MYDTTVLRPFGARDSSAITQRDPRPQEPGIGEPGTDVADRPDDLLAAILGNLELLEMRLSDPHLVKLAQAAARSARHGAKLNEQMLAFSRKQYLSPKPIDLNELVLGTQDLLRRSLGGNVEVTTFIAANVISAIIATPTASPAIPSVRFAPFAAPAMTMKSRM